MDVGKYDFESQKILHQAYQYARSLGHISFEVEHVSLAYVNSDVHNLDSDLQTLLRSQLEHHLRALPKFFGDIKINFGVRLNRALDLAENASQPKLVTAETMWKALLKESTILQNTVLHAKDMRNKSASSDTSKTIPPTSSGPKSKTPHQDGDFMGLDEFAKLSNHQKKNSKAGPSGKGSEEFTPVQPTTSDTTEQLRKQKILGELTTDFTELAERGELDPVMGRGPELRRLLEILGRKKKNNPLLIGEPGVGKSAIVEALAQKLTSANGLESLKGVRILSLDMTSLMAGTRYRGEFETRVKSLLQALEEVKSFVILFIDEIHMIMGAGSSGGEGASDFANMLKPTLARGGIKIIGATTLAEYRKYIEKDQALERRFQPIFVEEPSQSEAISILRGLKAKYETHHGVRIADDALTASVRLSSRYLVDRRLPDKAIDLVDESASKLKLQMENMPAELEAIKSEILRLELEKKTLGHSTKNKKIHAAIDSELANVKKSFATIEKPWLRHRQVTTDLKSKEKKRLGLTEMLERVKGEGNLDLASQLIRVEIPKLDHSINECRLELHALQTKYNFLSREVGAREVADTLSAWTGIPLGRILEAKEAHNLSLAERIQTRVYGQENAVESMCRAVKRAQAGINDPNRPRAVLLFIGPSGVGKTELARALSEELFDDDSKLVRIDMSEYMQEHSVARLIGAPPGYVGFASSEHAFERLRQQPFSVVLFDEIEKAHPRVLDILLQILEDGRLTDSRGRLIDFRQTYVILTSNVAIEQNGYESATADERDIQVRAALSDVLRPEFVNRLDEVVEFKKLGKNFLYRLLDRFEDQLNLRLKDKEFRVHIGEKLREELVSEAFKSGFGPRALRRIFDKYIYENVAERILSFPFLVWGSWIIEKHEKRIKWYPDTRKNYFLAG